MNWHSASSMAVESKIAHWCGVLMQNGFNYSLDSGLVWWVTSKEDVFALYTLPKYRVIHFSAFNSATVPSCVLKMLQTNSQFLKGYIYIFLNIQKETSIFGIVKETAFGEEKPSDY